MEVIELKKPLNHVIEVLGNVKTKIKENEHVQQAIYSATLALYFVQDLIDWASILRGEFQKCSVTFDLREVIDYVKNLVVSQPN